MSDIMDEIHQNRRFMHSPIFAGPMSESDQSKGISPPPFGKKHSGKLIDLPSFENTVINGSFTGLLDIRRSIRNFTSGAITGEQLAFILWSTQGIQSLRGDTAVFRTVPSGGARHAFETYIAVKKVEGLESGLYHYLPTENIGEKKVCIEKYGNLPSLDDNVAEMLAGQNWTTRASVVMFFTCIPYRAEWRYREMAHRVMLIDLGHLGQNLMLSAAALDLGSCCMAAFDQKVCDKNLGIDGMDEYTVYAAAIGPYKETLK